MGPAPAVIEVLRALALAMLLALAGTAAAIGQAADPSPAPALSDLVAAAGQAVPEAPSVAHIIERRCVVCHGCYDAPCQLKLSSTAGLARGASKQMVYDTGRLTEAQPTRLGIDAHGAAGWAAFGFFPVVPDVPGNGADASTLARLLALGRRAHLPPGKPLPDEIDPNTNRTLACPSPGEAAGYAAANPLGGMPFGTAPLSDAEFVALGDWVVKGAALPERNTVLPAEIELQIADWEAFLNDTDARSRLVARYLYEHLFLAHLHFEGDGPDRFFRLVRSTTPPGQPVAEIASRRPYDDPGPAFHYRLLPIAETIVYKDHLVYEIGPRRMARYRALFLEGDWSVETLPAYGSADGANPFITFAAIPAGARYRFLLDDALFFVRGFIRGPVCHGQIATDVIQDRFWVAFLAPEADLSVTDPRFLADGAALLTLPVAAAGKDLFVRLSAMLQERHNAWLLYRDTRYLQSPDHAAGLGYEAVWDGDGENPQGLLTVFRNFNNASVVTGFVGAVPKTAWVIDFPEFERIYYDLVAGYDVFSSVEIQLATRLYMDHLRREGEDLFLSFMPPDMRLRLHRDWYRGLGADLDAGWNQNGVVTRLPSAVPYLTDDPKREFLLTLLARGDGLWPLQDPINNRPAGAAAAGDTEAKLSRLTSRHGTWVRFLPDLSLLRVTGADTEPRVFTLFHDKAHTNVGWIAAEPLRRKPEDDTATILRGQIGSYPNMMFDLPEGDVAAFVDALMSMQDWDDWLWVMDRFGVRRTAPDFWTVADAMQDDIIRQNATLAGLLDLSRYNDPKPGGAPD